ncbi:hypothetical protein B0T21DRAFT_366100 [Apiosordaria backusii]|uniref:Uncharacterized protein n=1 Tax=Apiosordaria backusii TaxID=314023 RepID=A0AA40BKS6_9PEZI|nr:hypothetical protein B0T21DRAFT_366100 [Apiosordaria backusii]
MAPSPAPAPEIKDDWLEVDADSDDNYSVQSYSDSDSDSGSDSEVGEGGGVKSATDSDVEAVQEGDVIASPPETEGIGAVKVTSKIGTEDAPAPGSEAHGADDTGWPSSKGEESGDARRVQDDQINEQRILSGLRKAHDTFDFAWRGLEPFRCVLQEQLDQFIVCGYALHHFDSSMTRTLAGLLDHLDALQGLAKQQMHSGLQAQRKRLQQKIACAINLVSELCEPMKKVYITLKQHDLGSFLASFEQSIDAIVKHLRALMDAIAGQKKNGCTAEYTQMSNVVDFCNFAISSCLRAKAAATLWSKLVEAYPVNPREVLLTTRSFGRVDFDYLETAMREIKTFEAKLASVTKYKSAGVEWRVLSGSDLGGDNWAAQANPWLALAQDKEKTAWQRYHYKIMARVNIGELAKLQSVIPVLTDYLERRKYSRAFGLSTEE